MPQTKEIEEGTKMCKEMTVHEYLHTVSELYLACDYDTILHYINCGTEDQIASIMFIINAIMKTKENEASSDLSDDECIT